MLRQHHDVDDEIYRALPRTGEKDSHRNEVRISGGETNAPGFDAIKTFCR